MTDQDATIARLREQLATTQAAEQRAYKELGEACDRHRIEKMGLVADHDRVGFSLTDSLIECQRRGWKPCLNDFRAEARRAGWEPERIDRTIESAISDAKAMSTSPPPQP